MSRGGFKIVRNSFDFASSERVSWLDEFAENIDKASQNVVEVGRYRNELSLQDQINSIVSRQPASSTVAEKIQEYHKRTGLADYLKAKAVEKPDKVAFSLNEHNDVFDNNPARDKIIDFTKNKIDSSYGQTSIPNIQNEILAQFSSEGLLSQDVENEKVAKFISDLIAAAQQEHPTTDVNSAELGKDVGLDLSDVSEDNNDFYKPLLPHNN